MIEVSEIDKKILECKETIILNQKRMSGSSYTWMLFVPLVALTLLIAGIVGVAVGANFMRTNSWILVAIYLVAVVSIPVYAIYVVKNQMVKRAPIVIEKMEIEIEELKIKKQEILIKEANAKLNSYKRLLNDNVISLEEFEAKKREILAEMSL